MRVPRNLSALAANDARNERESAGTIYDQWAAEAEDAEDLRRALDKFDTRPMAYPACSNGPCRQGRGICPSPDACRLPEGRYDAEGRSLLRTFFLALAIVVVLLGAAVMFGGPRS